MRFPTVVLAMAAGVAFSAPAQAQEQGAPRRLESGNWTGTVTPPGEQTVDLVYVVGYAGDTLHITMNAGQHGIYEAIEPKIEAGKLSFGLQLDRRIYCVLDAKDDGFAGICTDDGGGAATMDFWPPKKED